MIQKKPRIGISRAPGGLPGIDAHIGAWMALWEYLGQRGMVPTDLFGTSAGAVVSAFEAAGQLPTIAADIIRPLRDADVIRYRWGWKARLLWMEHICDPGPIRDLLAEHLPESYLDLRCNLTCGTTCMTQQPHAEHIARGDLRRAVLASMAIAGVWPYVELGGRLYSDGATTDGIIVPADLHQYELFIVVNITSATGYGWRDRNVLSRLWWTLDQLTRVEEMHAARKLTSWPNARWLNIDIGETGALHWNHDLIPSAYEQAWRQIKEW